MTDKKVTDVMLDRIKYLLNAVENGEYEPQGYAFTIKLNYDNVQAITITDSSLLIEK